MAASFRQIEFLARAIVNRLEDRGLIEFHDAEAGLHVVVRTLEENFRRSLIVADGSFAVFVQRPISLVLLLLAAVLLVSVALPFIRRRRVEVFQE